MQQKFSWKSKTQSGPEMKTNVQENYTIIELLSLREEAYREITNALLQVLQPVFVAVDLLLDDETRKSVKWVNVEPMESTMPEINHVLIVGICKFPVGHVVTLENDEEMEVTETNQELLQRILRIGIPTTLVEQGDVAEIRKFLEEHTDMGGIGIKLKEETEIIKDFDLDVLTDKQRRAMISHGSKGKMN